MTSERSITIRQATPATRASLSDRLVAYRKAMDEGIRLHTKDGEVIPTNNSLGSVRGEKFDRDGNLVETISKNTITCPRDMKIAAISMLEAAAGCPLQDIIGKTREQALKEMLACYEDESAATFEFVSPVKLTLVFIRHSTYTELRRFEHSSSEDELAQYDLGETEKFLVGSVKDIAFEFVPIEEPKEGSN